MTAPSPRPPSRLQQLRRERTRFRDATWPELDIPLKLMVITTADVQRSIAGAYTHFREIGIPVDMVSLEDFQGEVALQILFRACRDAGDPWEKTLALDAEDLRESTTVQQRAKMLEAYEAWVRECSTPPAPAETAS